MQKYSANHQTIIVRHIWGRLPLQIGARIFFRGRPPRPPALSKLQPPEASIYSSRQPSAAASFQLSPSSKLSPPTRLACQRACPRWWTLKGISRPVSTLEGKGQTQPTTHCLSELLVVTRATTNKHLNIPTDYERLESLDLRNSLGFRYRCFLSFI